jgi:hypothetical protein
MAQSCMRRMLNIDHAVSVRVFVPLTAIGN